MSLRKDLLSKGKEALDAIKLPFKVRKEKKDAEQWILNKEQKIAELEFKIQEAKGAENLDFDKIADMIDERDLIVRRLDQGQKLSDELFEQE